MVSSRGSFLSRRNHTLPRRSVFTGLLTVSLITWLIPGDVRPQTALRSRSQLLGADVPFSFPEKFVVGPKGEIYILDTDLSTLFVLNDQGGNVKRFCGPEKLSSPSDVAINRNGNLWVLSALRSKIFKLTPRCEAQTEIVSRRLPLRIAINSMGEVIVLNGSGDNLFELYGPDGKFLRGFGQRFNYKDETTNSELSDGRIAPDRSGGFFFSFNYPPLIRHYGRQGNLIGEFKPESDVVIASPSVSVRTGRNSMVVSSKYQILVLDMTVDSQGRLYLLMSGKNKVPALTEGSRKLSVLAGDGRVLRTADLEYNFHSIAAKNRNLYLLRNKKPLRLDTYAVF